MKRLISVLLVLCLLLGISGIAFAAKITITEQPETQTVKKGGNLTISLKAKNASGSAITWHFQNPDTGEDITGKNLSKHVPGIKVSKPNSLSITLRKVPESMHGWTVYCHIGPKGSGVDSDTVMILIEGKEPPATPAATVKAGNSSSSASASSKSGTSASSSSSASKVSASPVEEEKAQATPTPAVPTATPRPEKIVISGSTRVELYKVDSKGAPVGKSQLELTFTEGTADFYVKLPGNTDGYIQYISLDGVRFTPDGEVRGMGIKGWPSSAAVKVKVLKPGAEATETSEALILPDETVAPADPSTLVTVTCENCRFTGYKSSYAKSGQVPVGTTITVIASGGMVSKGYVINGAKKATHKNEATFQYVVEGDTTITMEKQK